MKIILTIPKELDDLIDKATLEKRVDELIITPLINDLKRAKLAQIIETERPKIKNELQKVREKVSINITGVTPAPNETFNAGYTPPQGATNDVIINSKDI